MKGCASEQAFEEGASFDRKNVPRRGIDVSARNTDLPKRLVGEGVSSFQVVQAAGVWGGL